jgi:hypothetical protein
MQPSALVQPEAPRVMSTSLAPIAQLLRQERLSQRVMTGIGQEKPGCELVGARILDGCH